MSELKDLIRSYDENEKKRQLIRSIIEASKPKSKEEISPAFFGEQVIKNTQDAINQPSFQQPINTPMPTPTLRTTPTPTPTPTPEPQIGGGTKKFEKPKYIPGMVAPPAPEVPKKAEERKYPYFEGTTLTQGDNRPVKDRVLDDLSYKNTAPMFMRNTKDMDPSKMNFLERNIESMVPQAKESLLSLSRTIAEYQKADRTNPLVPKQNPTLKDRAVESLKQSLMIPKVLETGTYLKNKALEKIGLRDEEKKLWSKLSDTTKQKRNVELAYLEDMRKQNKAEGREFLGDVVSGAAGMIPNIALSALNPAVGTASFFTKAAGSSAGQALDEGKTPDQALAYGAVIGTAEAAMERLFIKQLTKLIPGKFKTELLKNATTNTLKNIGQVLKQVGKSALAEGVEESAMVPVEGIARKLVLNDELSAKDIFDLKEMMNQFFLGATIGAVLSGPTIPSNVKQMNQAKKYIEDNVTPTVYSGMALPANYESRKMAEQFLKDRRVPNLGELETLQNQLAQDYQTFRQALPPAKERVSNKPSTEIQTPDVIEMTGQVPQAEPVKSFFDKYLEGSPQQIIDDIINKYRGKTYEQVRDMYISDFLAYNQQIDESQKTINTLKTLFDDKFIDYKEKALPQQTQAQVLPAQQPQAPQQPKANTTLMSQRSTNTYSGVNVGARNIQAYQFENPEIKPYYQIVAQYILNNEFVPNAQLDRTTEVMEKIKADTNLTPKQVKEGLERLVRNEGQENVAVAKKVEVVLDDLLTNGFDTFDGFRWNPEQDFLNIKSQIEGKQIKPAIIDRELPVPSIDKGIAKPTQRQQAIQQPKAEVTPAKEPKTTQQPMQQEVAKQFQGRPEDTLGILPKSLRGLKSENAFAFENQEVESEYWKSKGMEQKTLLTRIKDGVGEVLTSFQRSIQTLPYTPEFAQLNFDLTRAKKIRGIVADDTVRTLDTILNKNDIPDYDSFDLFSRKVLLDDLMEESKTGNKLPNKFTPDIVESELKRIDSMIEKSPWVKRAIDSRKEVWAKAKNDYITAMKDIGVDLSDRFNKENYFRHQVLQYANASGLYGTGDKLKTPMGRGFQKARSGEFEGSINTDYLQAEYEVLAQMKYDTEIAKILKKTKDKYDIAPKLKAEAKKLDVNWKSLIPEDYTTWQPREGNLFYMVNSIPDKMATELIQGALETLEISAEDIKKVIALGGKKPEWVLKKEVAKTLDTIFEKKQDNKLLKGIRTLTNQWKRWVLTRNPKQVVKYNIRNLTGDLDPVITMNPGTLKKSPKAMQELYDAMKNGKFTPSLKKFYDLGAYQGLYSVQEISDIGGLQPFDRFSKKNMIQKTLTPLKKYDEFTTNTTNYREMILRYATYLDYLDQMKNSPNGLPKNYGASNPDIIKSIKSIDERAYILQNQLLGAYDEVSEAGQILRQYLIPFYSWMEVNPRRTVQMMKNILNNQDTAEKVGRKAFKLGSKITKNVAIKSGIMLLRLTAMTALMSAYNALFWNDEEELLPEDVRNRPHLILGKSKDGEIYYFSRLGALNDFLEYFGLDTITADTRDILNGRKTIKEQVADMVKSPINKVVQGITPNIKTPAEFLTGKTLFPDAFNPKVIRDKSQFVAQTFGLKREFDLFTGRPVKGKKDNLVDTAISKTKDFLTESLVYKADPGESAYYDIVNLKYEWIKKNKGDKGANFFYNEKSNALYNYKLARRYGDKRAEDKFLKKYIGLGGKIEDIPKKIDEMGPLYRLSENDKVLFYNSLTNKEKQVLELAQNYFESFKNQ